MDWFFLSHSTNRCFGFPLLLISFQNTTSKTLAPDFPTISGVFVPRRLWQDYEKPSVMKMAGRGPGWRFIPWPAYLRSVKYETNHWLHPDEMAGIDGFNVNGGFSLLWTMDHRYNIKERNLLNVSREVELRSFRCANSWWKSRVERSRVE